MSRLFQTRWTILLFPTKLANSGLFTLNAVIKSLFLGCMLVFSCAAMQAQESLDEYGVKLAFLFNFTKFVEWPDQAPPGEGKPFNICVVGSDPFGKDAEKELSKREVARHPISLVRVDSGSMLRGCQMVFVPVTERKRLSAILFHVRGRDILTVGEASGFLNAGGQINLIFAGNSLHFEVNFEATQQSHLRFSSKLLGLASNLGSQPKLNLRS